MHTEVIKHTNKSKQEYRIVLIIKSWDKNISTSKRNAILAEALNYCVVKERVHIKGYLIARRRLFLILKSKHHSLDKILNYFTEKILELLYVAALDMELDALAFENSYHKLFKKYPLYNPYIIKTLTGKKIGLPYRNLHVEKLKTIINTYNYCSTIDYSGAIGPVIVDTK